MRYFDVGDWSAVFVDAGHEVPDHVVFVLFALGACLAAGVDDVEIRLGHFLLGSIASAVVGEGRPGEHEVDGGEAHVEVMVEVGEGRVEFGADFLSLQGAGGGVDGYFGHGFGDVEGAAEAEEAGGGGNVVLDFLGYEGDMGF